MAIQGVQGALKKHRTLLLLLSGWSLFLAQHESRSKSLQVHFACICLSGFPYVSILLYAKVLVFCFRLKAPKTRQESTLHLGEEDDEQSGKE